MDLIDQLRSLSARIPRLIEAINTEEATKTAFVLPFIAALGYDVFEPAEVVPEFIADVGLKKGEKVDYAIMKDKQPIILFECKSHSSNLAKEHASQLHRYFHVTKARVAVLTNGIIYRFYSDLEEANKMDSKPFLELNLLDIKEPVVEEVKRFTKSAFNIDEIVNASRDLKYMSEIKRLLGEEFTNPSADFVKHFSSQIYTGKLTQKMLDQFTVYTRIAVSQFVGDRINERLNAAMSAEEPRKESTLTANVPELSSDIGLSTGSKEDKITTTQDELESYHIIKAILRQTIESKRIVLRDAQSYASVLLDDNNRKPICRLRFNGSTKYIGIFDANKNEEKFVVQAPDDIFMYAERLKEMVLFYDSQMNSKDPVVAALVDN
jgi:hypothetical protein